MPYSNSSHYKQILIGRPKDNAVVPIEAKTLGFKYYESIFSPILTASLTYYDVGDLVRASSNVDVQTRLGTLRDSLPIIGKGQESVQFFIENESGFLDFRTTPFRVSNPTPISQDSQSETVTLSLLSESSVINGTHKSFKSYHNTISSSIEKILTDELGFPTEKVFIDQTSNSDSFRMNGSRPFDIITSMAKKSVSSTGGPGYFFWETQDGMNYKSIDSIIQSDPVATYTHTDVMFNTDDRRNDFKILKEPVYHNNSNVLSNMYSGISMIKEASFDMSTFGYVEKQVPLASYGHSTLGNNIDFQALYDDEDKTNVNFSRTVFSLADSGFTNPGISSSIVNDKKFYLSRSIQRYNLLMSHVIDIIVPCNLALHAGDVINCIFQKISFDSKHKGNKSELNSGKYIITHLCHDFSPRSSYTSLRIVRDTPGIYTNTETTSNVI